ncbi:MAG TPA: hypothetical protein VK399_07075 [Longimicrobiaceae bacterium]|jgi:hypothetical protein|nr:hypothetical protein [Longimicrobiaceae bacterium]
MKRIPFIAVLLLLAPLSLGAQGQGDPAQRIEAARRRADATGIPVSLLDLKVAEGRAKGASPDRIAGAVEIRLSLLSRAREAMAGAGRGALSAADLSAGADALSAGVSTEALGSLTRSAPGDRRAVAIAVLAQLVQEGDGSDRALERVRLALANPETLRTLPGQVKRGNGNANGLKGEQGPGKGDGVGLANSPPNGVGGAGKPVHGDDNRKRPRRP